MCVGEHDRIYALTELGVQCIRPFGLIDAIAPLPDGVSGGGICIDMSGGEKRLVVSTDRGAYSRAITEPAEELAPNEPKPNSYYD